MSQRHCCMLHAVGLLHRPQTRTAVPTCLPPYTAVGISWMIQAMHPDKLGDVSTHSTYVGNREQRR